MHISEDSILFLSQNRIPKVTPHFIVDSVSGKVAGIANITNYMARILAILGKDCRFQDELYKAMQTHITYTGLRKYRTSYSKCLDINYRILACQNSDKPISHIIFTRNPLLNDATLLSLQPEMDIGEQAANLLLIGLRNESDVCSSDLSQLIKTAFPDFERAIELCVGTVGKDKRLNYGKMYKWLNIFTIQGKSELASDNLLLPYAVDYLIWRGYAEQLVMINDALLHARQVDIDLLYNLAASLCLGSSTYRATAQTSAVENYKFSIIRNAMQTCIVYLEDRIGRDALKKVMFSTYYLTEVLCADMTGYRDTMCLENSKDTLLDYIMMNTEFR